MLTGEPSDERRGHLRAGGRLLQRGPLVEGEEEGCAGCIDHLRRDIHGSLREVVPREGRDEGGARLVDGGHGVEVRARIATPSSRFMSSML